MSLKELIPVPPKDTLNRGLAAAGNQMMLDLFGHPVDDGAYHPAGECTGVTNPTFKTRLVTASLGPFRATGIKPAIESLQGIFARIRVEQPELYGLLGTAGMHCARFTKIRQPDGSLKIGPSISNHSWGTAIDINVGGVLDKQGNNLTQRGLLVAAPYFNDAGWYWGAAFGTEDAMHFEVSKGTLQSWKVSGKI